MSKFVILHAASCAVPVHYRIHPDGSCEHLLAETEQGVHKDVIAIGLAGNCVEWGEEHPQLLALRELLAGIHRRYPAISLGGHRQIRGSNTDCPGQDFPLSKIQAWWRGAMLEAHDAWFDDVLASAYLPRLDQ
jgi:N-acetyl-anhydromuramyl-L-alanine amidase AmpD